MKDTFLLSDKAKKWWLGLGVAEKYMELKKNGFKIAENQNIDEMYKNSIKHP